MPTPITKGLKAELRTAQIDLLERVVRKADFWFHEDEIYNNMWSEEDRKIVLDALNRIAIDFHLQHNSTTNIMFTHETLPCAIPVSATVILQCRGTSKYCHVLPRHFTIAGLLESSKAARECFYAYMGLSYTVGMAKEMLDKLLDKCTNLEQMRYMFPPLIGLLRYRQYGDLANRVENVKGAPRQLPRLSPLDRSILRYLIQWYAMQELVDGFSPKLPAKVTTDTNRRLKISSDADAHVDTEHGIEYITFSAI